MSRYSMQLSGVNIGISDAAGNCLNNALEVTNRNALACWPNYISSGHGAQ